MHSRTRRQPLQQLYAAQAKLLRVLCVVAMADHNGIGRAGGIG
jgi:hypothetical protein